MGLPDRPSKHEAFLALLREGWTSLHLDARRAGVVVPAHLQSEGHLVLQYGHDLPIPIPDLQVDEDGVTATLSFARAPHQTVVPWSAVYVVASDDGRGVLYQEDVPPDVSVIARGEPDAAPGTALSEGPGGVVDALPVDIAPTPPRTRTLRAVPLVGPFDDFGDHPGMGTSTAAVQGQRRSDGGVGAVGAVGAEGSDGVNKVTRVGASAPVLSARRRKRPQLRLVK